MFDNSAIDTSQDTMITEPDAEVLAPVPPILSPPRRQPSMTREEARRVSSDFRASNAAKGARIANDKYRKLRSCA